MKDFLKGVFEHLWQMLMIGAGVIVTIDAVDAYRTSRDRR